MTGEAEPRRSVRATKGQHTKAFDELDQLAAPKRRQNRKTKKAQEQGQSQESSEVIRCVCGANKQDGDSGEAWICCETCFVWQHNVCVGVSSFEDEIPEYYWCEQCRPQDHKELLEGMAKGEKPWEERRRRHELEEPEKKKRRGGRRGRAKRVSDSRDVKDVKEDLGQGTVPLSTTAAPVKDKKDTGAKHTKRKSREESPEADGQTIKQRRVSDRDTVVAPVPKYAPPPNLATSVASLPGVRIGPAKALKKSLTHVITSMVKSQELELAEGESEETLAEKHALEIERAVFDTHPVGKGQKEYTQQIKSLTFNLKNNPELCRGLLAGVHLPTTLAVMSSEELASAEQQRLTAEMRARAEKQSILYTSDTGVRVRRTHKGEEVIEDENLVQELPLPLAGGPRKAVGHGAGTVAAAAAAAGASPADGQREPGPTVKRESTGGEQSHVKGRPTALQQPSPSQSDFDINKVFSTVRSPTVGHGRKPSVPAINTAGPGFDPDVDRMLEDENESPPYSPTEEAQDPDVVWRGSLAMSSIADFQAKAKHVGGANFARIGPWAQLIPKRLTVAGRITQQSAIEYLCGLRYSNLTDIIVVSLEPASPTAKPDYDNLVNYFFSKQRYGVVGNKVAGNVRDTYLVPVPAGEGGHPEFMLNLVDNAIPLTRTEPMLLCVFVYRNEPDQLKKALEALPTQAQGGAAAVPSPTTVPGGPGAQRSTSASGPAFSPATPQAPFAAQLSRPGQQPHHLQSQQSQPEQESHHQQHQQLPSRPSAAYAQQPAGPQSNTPVPIPQPRQAYRSRQGSQWSSGSGPNPSPPASAPSQSPTTVAPTAPPQERSASMSEAQKRQAQAAGHQLAQEILGSWISAPTVQFLLPQAYLMTRKEWEVIRDLFEREPRSRDDLECLGKLLGRGPDGGSKADDKMSAGGNVASAAAGNATATGVGGGFGGNGKPT